MTNIGTLVTRVFTSRTQLPIIGATVTVLKRNGDGSHTLLATRNTDQNGKTAPVAIETPYVMESLSPGEPQAFTLVDVWAAHPEYSLIEVRDIEIFPGVESVQEIPMLPLSRSQLDISEQSKQENSNASSAQGAPEKTE